MSNEKLKESIGPPSKLAESVSRKADSDRKMIEFRSRIKKRTTEAGKALDWRAMAGASKDGIKESARKRTGISMGGLEPFTPATPLPDRPTIGMAIKSMVLQECNSPTRINPFS